MERKKVILDMLQVIGFTREEILDLVKNLISNSELKPIEVYTEEMQLFLRVAKKMHNLGDNVMVTLGVEPDDGAPKKGPGRPKNSNKKAEKEEDKGQGEKPLAEDTIQTEENKATPELETPAINSCDKEVEAGKTEFESGSFYLPSEYELTNGEKYDLRTVLKGRVLDFEILYLWRNKLIRTSKSLVEGEVIGIIIPYQKKKQGSFIISFKNSIYKTEENARSDAKKMGPYMGNEWGLLTSTQFSAISSKLSKINSLIKHLGGGHLITNDYFLDGVVNKSVCEKFRYTVDVPMLKK